MKRTTMQAALAASACVASLIATPAAYSASSVTAPTSTQGRQVLDVRAVSQQGQNWCWIATGLTMTQYLGHGQRASQNDFCNAGLSRHGGRCPDVTGRMYNVQNGARHFGAYGGRATGTLSFATVKSNIDSNSPMPAGYYWEAGGGHMVGIVGYDDRSNDLLINNSLRGARRQSWINHNTFVSNRQWRWAESIVGMSSGARAEEVSRKAQDMQSRKADDAGFETAATVKRSGVPTSAEDTQRVASFMSSLASTSRGEAAQDVEIAASDVQLSGDRVAVHSLNPDFVRGASMNPATLVGEAQRATSGEKSIVMIYADGDEKFSYAHSDDDEYRYGAMAGEGVVFSEPQVHAFYALNGDRVTPLNDMAREAVGDGVSVAEYQRIVADRYADKLEGSQYQATGSYGALK